MMTEKTKEGDDELDELVALNFKITERERREGLLRLRPSRGASTC